MRFLYSHRTRSSDGQYVHIKALTDALRARGGDVVMAGPGGVFEKGVKKLDAGGGSAARSLLPAPIYECAEYGYSVISFNRLRNLAAASKPDILYERYNLFYHAGAWLRRKTGLPLILEVNAPLSREREFHGDLFWKAFARRSEATIWRAADMVLPVTDALANDVRAAGVGNEKITIIKNGVGPEFLIERNPQLVRKRYGLENRMVLGFTGFVRPWHGVDRVIKFLAARQDPRLHFLLVGDGPIRSDLEALAEALGVADQITVTGVIQHQDLPDHVAAFDIALQPAVTAYASPLKLFEYMALAKPVVAPDSANIREVLSDGEDAILFQDNDQDFEKALAALVNDAALRTHIGAAARKSLIRQDLTWAGNARRVEKISEILLEKAHDHPYRN